MCCVCIPICLHRALTHEETCRHTHTPSAAGPQLLRNAADTWATYPRDRLAMLQGHLTAATHCQKIDEIRQYQKKRVSINMYK